MYMITYDAKNKCAKWHDEWPLFSEVSSQNIVRICTHSLFQFLTFCHKPIDRRWYSKEIRHLNHPKRTYIDRDTCKDQLTVYFMTICELCEVLLHILYKKTWFQENQSWFPLFLYTPNASPWCLRMPLWSTHV